MSKISVIFGETRSAYVSQVREMVEAYRFMDPESRVEITNVLDLQLVDLKNETVVPIGSVEFTHDILRKLTGRVPKPINIPEGLGVEFTGRAYSTFESVGKVPDNWYVKPFAEAKQFDTFVKGVDPVIFPGKVFASAPLSPGREVVGEFRCFLGSTASLENIRWYAGKDCYKLPDLGRLRTMAEALKRLISHPFSFDVFLMDDGNVYLVGAHHWYSTGLYGYDNANVFVINSIRWFRDYYRGAVG